MIYVIYLYPTYFLDDGGYILIDSDQSLSSQYASLRVHGTVKDINMRYVRAVLIWVFLPLGRWH